MSLFFVKWENTIVFFLKRKSAEEKDTLPSQLVLLNANTIKAPLEE